MGFTRCLRGGCRMGDTHRPPAGYVTVPAEMSEAQAIASLAGSPLAMRMQSQNPDLFAKLIEARRGTWRELVLVMMEVPHD